MDESLYARAAKYYDGAYVNNPVLKDIPFYVELARQRGGPVLELGCGTGRVLLEIARAGIEILGVDLSGDQLAVLESKRRNEPESIRRRISTLKGDMRSLALGRRFPLVIIPFRPMQHMYTVDDQVNALNAAREHLEPGGMLAFDVFHPNYAILLEPPDREKLELEWPDTGHPGVVVRRYFRKTRVDFLRQLMEGEFTFRTFDGDRLISEEQAPLKLAYYTYPQLMLLFRHCSLELVEQYGSFAKEPVDICKELIFILKSAH